MLQSQKLPVDIIGIMAGVLCVIHCMATPLLLLSQYGMLFGSEVKNWWGNMDFLFSAISFLAIFFTTLNSKSMFINSMLWVFWLALKFLIK